MVDVEKSAKYWPGVDSNGPKIFGHISVQVPDETRLGKIDSAMRRKMVFKGLHLESSMYSFFLNYLGLGNLACSRLGI